MRKFNPERELYKIKYGKRDKIVLGIILLLVIISVGSTFALYQVRRSKRIIYTKVAPFNNKDIELAVYIDDKPSAKFPEKGEGYYYDGIDCDNDSNAYATWDYNRWKLKDFEVSVPNKCNINFTTKYRDSSGANPPELYQGMIPVIIEDNGTIKVANTDTNWHDYGEKRWANAVLVDNSKVETNNKYFNEDNTLKSNLEGTQIDMTEILQMYVWIPRYKYQLFNVNNDGVKEQMINIKFENRIENTGNVECEYTNNNNGTITEKCTEKGTETNAQNGYWYTHPAFTFGETELSGIWIGKFEPSGTSDDITILPDKVSLRPTDVSTMFNITRNIEKNNKYSLNSFEVDTHMMKSIEWGAMTYLTYSKYGRCTTDGTCTEPTINAHKDYVTGYANSNDFWYTKNGALASTTGNPYGIFDIVGGSCEYVMGIMIGNDGKLAVGKSGFLANTFPNKKYYDIYSYSTSFQSYEIGHLGDATREVLKTTNDNWDGSLFRMVVSDYPYVLKSGLYSDGTYTGLFYTYSHPGDQIDSRILDSFRIVLTAHDGNE